MKKNVDKKSQIVISNEVHKGPSIIPSRADFEKSHKQVSKKELKGNPQNQNDNKPKDKPQQ